MAQSKQPYYKVIIGKYEENQAKIQTLYLGAATNSKCPAYWTFPPQPPS